MVEFNTHGELMIPGDLSVSTKNIIEITTNKQSELSVTYESGKKEEAYIKTVIISGAFFRLLDFFKACETHPKIKHIEFI